MSPMRKSDERKTVSFPLSTAPALALENVTVTFVAHGGGSTYTAVRDTTLIVGEGEFVSVVGPTGCGKSTLLNIAAGLLESSAAACGCRASCSPASTPRRLHVPVGRAAAVAFRARQRRTRAQVSRRRARRRARAGDGLAGARWFERARRPYPHQLSGGMKKTRGVGPDADPGSENLLMDEPFSALDIQTRQLMENELLELWCPLTANRWCSSRTIWKRPIALSDRVVVLSAGPRRIRWAIT